MAKRAGAIYVLHSFKKTTQKTSAADLAIIKARYGLMGDSAMKTLDPRLTDTRITEGSGNIFVDLGFDPAEAWVMQMRTMLMIRIEQRLAELSWTQAEAAKALGITQPRVSRLKKGVWRDFSLDMLLTLATRAGLKPELTLAA